MAQSKAIKRILPVDEPIDISRDQITLLMMESYKKCSSSTEEIMCLREVAKMNGLYEQSATTQINVLNIEQNIKKLETMSDEDLLQLAGHGAKLFEKSPKQIVDDSIDASASIESAAFAADSIDADYVEVKD
jgi:hypothetical protein